MKRIQCYDIDGDSVNSLVQWDKNQVIYVNDLENGVIPMAHFAVATNLSEARVYDNAVSQENSMIKITIPNELLLESTELYIFLYYEIGTDESQTTKYFIELPIKAKPQPSSHVYEDNLQFIDLVVLQNELSKAIVDSTNGDKSLILTVDNLGKEWRFVHTDGITSLTITSSGIFENDIKAYYSVVFLSGTTATTFTNTIGAYFTGDDCRGGIFTPTANKTYDIGIYWNGITWQAIVRGV